MKLNFGKLLVIFINIAIKALNGHTYFRGGEIITQNEDKTSELYAFEMTIKESIEHCILSCKAKKQCKFISYDHLAKLCYHIGSDNTEFCTGSDVCLKDYIVEKSGFSYGDKRDWNMVGYEHCSHCNDYGVCNINSGEIATKCLNSGCRQPEKKKNAILYGNMFSVGDKIMYKCMEGFIADDTKPMTSLCLENGRWSKIDTNCFPEAAFDDNAFIFGDIFFKFIRDCKCDWDKARRLCEEQNMQLVSIKGTEVQNELITFIKKNSYINSCFWTGGLNVNGTFVWLDGTRVPLETGGHWKEGEPNKETEKCIELRKDIDYQWNNKQCYKQCCPICESF